MMNKKLFIRNQEGARLFYDVLSSSGNYYYEVEMLEGNAVSCQCKNFHLGKHFCKHMRTAEEAEKAFQAEQGEILVFPPEHPFLNAPLNGTAGFSLLR